MGSGYERMAQRLEHWTSACPVLGPAVSSRQPENIREVFTKNYLAWCILFDLRGLHNPTQHSPQSEPCMSDYHRKRIRLLFQDRMSHSVR